METRRRHVGRMQMAVIAGVMSREFANFRLLTFGALLVVMMISRPDGMIPSKRPRYEPPPEEVEKADAAEVSHE